MSPRPPKPNVNDCFTPAHAEVPGQAPNQRALDALRSVRYDALLELIDQIQRRSSIEALAQAAAARWCHCANVTNWRLLCVHDGQAVLLIARGRDVEWQCTSVDALPTYDQTLWHTLRPRLWNESELQTDRNSLPLELADPNARTMGVWPIQQGVVSTGVVSIVSNEPVFDALDRKFIQLVAGALCARLAALLTEQVLQEERIRAERQAMAQRQAINLVRLVNGLAHEFNTPLGIQITACDFLGQMVQDTELLSESVDDIKESVQLIQRQAHRGVRIVKRLKQISAAARGSSPQATDLVEELQLIVYQYMQNIDLNVEFQTLTDNSAAETSSVVVDLDREALHTVLIELLDNVRAHARPQEGQLRAKLTLQLTPDWIEICVCDNGSQFDAVQADSLFEPFHTNKQSLGHIGIGGYIAYNVAHEALNATLILKQHGASGTCVQLRMTRSP